ncbi:PIN domain-like protein, partial [Mycena olivaceomarginata]
IVKPVAQTISFKELCIKEGFVQKHRNIGTMIFGVDAYLWITQCQAVFHKPRHAQMGKNPELKALFYKLAALNQAGVTAVFVFDGPNKPSVKRDKQVRAKPHWLVAEFIKLIELFGFHYHMAPGEADSELGYLDNFGCIDGILTDDGDVAVFGASRIIRNPRRMNKDIPDEITVYTSESLNDIGLTRGGILLLAILGGGDYDTVGLAGCGSHIALALAHCGFGDSLLQASENMAEAELEEFLIQWREDLRTELATNSRGFLRSKQNTLSTKIPETFPSLRVLSLYVQPTTSWSNGFVPPATDKWIVKLPALPELAVYCNKEFGWNPAAIAEKFRRLIFSGLCTRRLTMVFFYSICCRDYDSMSLSSH